MTLKRPVTVAQALRWPGAAKRRQSFCARMGGMREKLTGEDAASDPGSRINRALADWDCDDPRLLNKRHVSKGIRPMKITTKMVGSEARNNPAQKVEIVERATLSNGAKIRLQKRVGKYDVTINSDGYAWRYLSKGTSESHARSVFDMWTMQQGTKTNPARKPAARKDDPFPSPLENYGPRKGLEGPFLMRNNRVVYYDPAEGAYYDPTTDFYLSREEAAELHSNPARKTARNPAKKPALPWVAHEPGKSPDNALVWFARKSDAIKHAQTLADKLGKPFAVSRGTPKPFPKWEFGK